jgi:hypothetical protein
MAYPLGQTWTRTGILRTLALTYSSIHSQIIIFSTTLQGMSFYFWMATQLIATPIYCLKVLLIITSLSFVYRITVLIPYRIWISVFGGSFKGVFQKRSRSLKITRYRLTRLIGFAWSKVAGDVARAFESTGIYHLNRNRVPEYLFSIFISGKL